MVRYMPAVSQAEADGLVQAGYGHKTPEAAERHLAKIKAPPTDPYYASQYSVYRVLVYPRVDSLKLKGQHRHA